MKVVAISGSPRLKGNTNYLVDRALGEITNSGLATEKIVISQHKVNPCRGHDACASYESCTQKDDAAWILENFRTADGVILASPVYYYNVSAQMKAFLDRNYWIYKHELEYRASTVGVIVVAEQEGIEDTLYTLRRFTDELNADDGAVFTVSGYAHEVGDVEKNLALVEEAGEMGRRMARYLMEKGEK